MNQQWILASRPVGHVDDDTFELRAQPVRDLGDGELLVRNIYLSLDPASRGWISDRDSYVEPVEIGAVMRGITVGVVEESKVDGFGAGDIVQGVCGWQRYWIGSGDDLTKLPPLPFPLEAVLAVLGHIGASAYFGLMDIGKPVAGETVVVSAAAGAVGSLVGQIAKIKGCRVVGIAGSDEKCAWLTDELGFDAAINYKSGAISDSLAAACKDGIDLYFDNVGGPIADAALGLINQRARIVLCGLISIYNATEPVPGPYNYANILVKRARVEGFIVTDYMNRFAESAMALAQWLAQGKLKYRVEIVDGLDNAPAAMARLFDGDKRGKLMIKVSDEKAG